MPTSVIRLLWFSQIIAIGSMEMSGPFWPLILSQQSQGVSLSVFSALIYILPLLGAMLSAPLWGKLGDRIGHKYMILRALFVLALSQYLLLYVKEVEWICLIRFVQGVCAGSIAAMQAYALRSTKVQEQGQILGKLQSSVAAGTLLGPVLGGILIDYRGFDCVFTLGSISCLLVFFAVALLLPEDKNVPFKKSTGKSTKQVTSPPLFSLPVLLCLLALAQLAKRLPSSFFAIYGQEVLEASSLQIGILYGLTGLAILLFAPYWGRYFDRANNTQIKNSLLLICTMAGLSQFAFSFVEQSLLLAGLLRFIWGIFLAAILPLLFMQLRKLVTTNEIGKSIGMGHSASKLGALIGIGIGAISISLLAINQGFSMIAVTYIIMIILIVIYTKKKGKEEY